MQGTLQHIDAAGAYFAIPTHSSGQTEAICNIFCNAMLSSITADGIPVFGQIIPGLNASWSAHDGQYTEYKSRSR